MRPVRILALALLACAGCTFGDGDPFGEVTAHIAARYEERADRDAGDGWQKLTSELEVKLSEMAITIDAVELVDLGGAAAIAFDPANPPPGYSLCHNGHCHSDEGALVDYEDIVAELGGNSDAARTALVLTGGNVDLLADQTLPLACTGACMLGMGHVARVRVGISSVTIAGAVRDGLAEPRFEGEQPLALDLSGGVLEAPVDLPFDDDHEPKVAIALELALSATLFDAAIDATGAVDAAAVSTAFTENNLRITIEREQ